MTHTEIMSLVEVEPDGYVNQEDAYETLVLLQNSEWLLNNALKSVFTNKDVASTTVVELLHAKVQLQSAVAKIHNAILKPYSL